MQKILAKAVDSIASVILKLELQYWPSKMHFKPDYNGASNLKATEHGFPQTLSICTHAHAQLTTLHTNASTGLAH